MAPLGLTLASVVLLLLIAGCADQVRGVARGPALGQAEIELQLGPSITALAASYDITRGDFRKSGTLDLSRSATLSAVIDGVPAGTGYQIALALDASTGGRALACAGSAPFAVVAGQVAAVPVHVTCHEPRAPQPREVPLSPGAIAFLGGLLLAIGARRFR